MTRAGAGMTASRFGAPGWLLGDVVAVLVPSLLVGSSTDVALAVVTAAVVLATATALAASRWTARFPVPLSMPDRREHHDAASATRGRATDPVHHPVRPRAPGLA